MNLPRCFQQILAVSCLLVSRQVQAQPGTPDPSWAGSGYSGLTPSPGTLNSDSTDGAPRLTPLPDGGLILSGAVDLTAGDGTRRWVPAMARFQANGQLDTGWGVGGQRFGSSINGRGTVIHALVRQSDGKFVAVRQSRPGEANPLPGIVVSRYFDSGIPDPTFGDGGSTVTTLGGATEQASALVIQDDGRILVAGTSNPGTGEQAVVLRYLADGMLDPGFGAGDGYVKLPMAGSLSDFADKMILLPGGGILVAGTRREPDGVTVFLLRRLLPDGSLDPDFGGGTGAVTTRVGTRVERPVVDLAAGADGKVILAGGGGILARYLPDGSLDITWAGKGYLILLNQVIMGMILQANGSPVVNTFQTINMGSVIIRRNKITRFTTEGGGDNRFGSLANGVTSNFTPVHSSIGDLALQADGKIVASGTLRERLNSMDSRQQWAVHRFYGDGPEIEVWDHSTATGRSLVDGTGHLPVGYAAAGGSVSTPFTVKNRGAALLTGFSAVVVAEGPSAEFSVNLHDATLSGSITFSPTGPGRREATLVLTSNDSDEAEFTVSLSGTGGDVGGLKAVFPNAGKPAVQAVEFNASGITVSMELQEAPRPGAKYVLVEQTGLSFIQGSFSNLAHGQTVNLTYAGVDYPFLVNYYGGSGNDVILQWANVRLASWGSNTSGQSGINGATLPRLWSNAAWGGRTPLAISPGTNFSLVLMTDGRLFGWGVNTNGQLGSGTASSIQISPVAVNHTGILAGKTVVAVATGTAHSLALCSDGTVAAWGQNTYGQLGDATFTQRLLPVLVNNTSGSHLSGRSVVAIGAGARHSVVLCSDGTLAAWGDNSSGQLGSGFVGSNRSTAGRVQFISSRVVKTFISFATGGDHTIALTPDNTLVSFGSKTKGQTGVFSSTEPGDDYKARPVDLQGSIIDHQEIISLSANQDASQVLCANGITGIWGNSGNLGYQYTGPGSTGLEWPLPGIAPNLASPDRSPVSLSSGASHTFLRMTDGTVFARGNNSSGQLGINSIVSNSAVVQVDEHAMPPGSVLTQVLSGHSAGHNLALAALPWHPGPHLAILRLPGNLWLRPAAEPVAWGTALNGEPSLLNFSAFNDGNLPLNSLNLSIEGPDAASFTATLLPAAPLSAQAGAGSPFSIAFSSPTIGLKQAVLRFSSDDPGVVAFEVPLTAMRALSASEWRQANFDSPANSGNGADPADPDGDGRSNFLEFATGTPPLAAGSPPELLARSGDALIFTYTRSLAGVAEGVIFKPEWTDDPSNEVWLNTGATQQILQQGLNEIVTVTLPASSSNALRRFVRLRVSRLP